ncbi:MAG: glycosyltransferase family 2 protein [Armatimonadetes bacterium]|nr:glycosyltransferase family 2 protein [Armatimonadota bacterium]
MTILMMVFWAAWVMIVYTYCLFPVLLALFARLFSAPSHTEDQEVPEDELPRVAMLVAAYNEAAVITAKLANAWQIDYPADRFQLLIGSDGSNDGTVELLQAVSDSRLRCVFFPRRRGKISVLNDLVRETDADIIVMSDANTMFAPDAIRKLLRHFRDPRVGCVSGELSLEQHGGASGEGLYWKYEGWIKRNESRLGFLIGCNGGIFAMRRDLYRPLPPSTVVEDFVLTMCVLQSGYLVCFAPEAKATEPPCLTARAEMIRKIRIGAGGFQALGLTYALLHPKYGFRAFAYWSHKVLRWLVPMFLLVALGTNAALVGLNFYRLLLLLQLGGALIAARAYTARPGAKLPKWTRPISYFYLMNFALFCGFLRFLFRTQRVTWERAAR